MEFIYGAGHDDKEYTSPTLIQQVLAFLNNNLWLISNTILLNLIFLSCLYGKGVWIKWRNNPLESNVEFGTYIIIALRLP